MVAQMKMEYLRLRKEILEKRFSNLNSMQREAVFHTEGPLLILAGAGSGKTTVLVHRIANLIAFGNAYYSDYVPEGLSDEDIELLKDYKNGDSELIEQVERLLSVNPASPWEILAITFTNKAAGELKQRLEKMLGTRGNDVWASTFHSFCARILRRHADLLGFSKSFTIYDTDDSRRLMKEVQKVLNIDEKIISHRSMLSEISRAKDKMQGPEEFEILAGSNYRLKKTAEAYALYQRNLKEANAMDFDDLIYNTVRLFEKHKDVLEFYQNKFRYILVDEYQDTNHSQYRLISLLAKKHRNLCVVGDDDQSIYKFRGATIENILSFEDHFNDAKVIRLEQNYRSTQSILDAANNIISNNTARKGKNLWTQNHRGDKITLYSALNGDDEAANIASTILDSVASGRRYSHHAVLYRINAQSNAIETSLIKNGIPYRIIGGHRFYDYKEIKDVIAYLSVINNPNDNIRLLRIINEPKRAIGEATINTISSIAEGLGTSYFEVVETADHYESLSRAANKLLQFAELINELIDLSGKVSLHELYQTMLNKTGYMEMLEAQGKEGEERIENLNEFASTILKYEAENSEPTLSGLLEEISLLSDIDNYDENTDSVVLMTIHSAKGLEFPIVFLPGLEEGVFPSHQSLFDPEQVEEERRLMYVAVTRAKEKLIISNARSRLLLGFTSYNKPSRFVGEIPPELIEEIESREERYFSGTTAKKSTSFERSAAAVSATKVGISNQAESAKTTYKIGDVVFHKVFGTGSILSAKPMGNDTLLEVAFDKVGTKKLMSNFAPLTLINSNERKS